MHNMQKVTDYGKKPWLITKSEKCFVSIICDYSLLSAALICREALLTVFTAANFMVERVMSVITSADNFVNCIQEPSLVQTSFIAFHHCTFDCSLNGPDIQMSISATSTTEHCRHYVHTYIFKYSLVTIYPKCPVDIWWRVIQNVYWKSKDTRYISIISESEFVIHFTLYIYTYFQFTYCHTFWVSR